MLQLFIITLFLELTSQLAKDLFLFLQLSGQSLLFVIFLALHSQQGQLQQVIFGLQIGVFIVLELMKLLIILPLRATVLPLECQEEQRRTY